MKNILSVIALSAVLASGAAVSSADAAVTLQYGFSSAAPGSDTGSDYFGNAWSWNNNGAGGNSVWGVPGLGSGIVTYTGANASDNFEITFLLPVFGTTSVIDQTPSTGGSYNTQTRLSVFDAGTWTEWTPTFINGNSVAFFGGTIKSGDSFYVNVAFTGSDLSGANAGFSATWSAGAVPEPSTWAMMLAGFAGLGFVGYRRNKAAAVAA